MEVVVKPEVFSNYAGQRGVVVDTPQLGHLALGRLLVRFDDGEEMFFGANELHIEVALTESNKTPVISPV